jgi:hypothetical protein
MRRDEKQNRAEEVRRRRDQSSRERVVVTKQRVAQKPAMPTTSRARASAPARRKSTRPVRRRYDVAMGLLPVARGGVRAPAFSLAGLGTRLTSGLIALAALGLMVLMLMVPPFVFSGATLVGAQRVGVLEVNSALGLTGQSIVYAVPGQLEAKLHAAFPEFSTIKVSVGFPGSITVTVLERTPRVAWQYNSVMMWIDSDGVAFPARGTADNVVPVMAMGVPPSQSGIDLMNPSLTARVFIAPETVLAIQSLQSYVPAGTMLIYDPEYGIGWTDPHGWKVYFGTKGSDIPLKLQVYQSIVSNLSQRGITPTLISVGYPDAPFYRVEQ